ncbi:MAG: hypothetical protein WCT05_16175 [Lentisphaeria bacterium]
MTEPTKERAVRIVLIPEVLYKKLEKIAKKTDATVMGLTSRALIEYLDKYNSGNHHDHA